MYRITIVLGMVWCTGLVAGSIARADVLGEIARIEALPRSKRLAEYENLADRKTLSDADRIPGATGRTSTNIMASSGEDFGSGGQRDLAFSESQAAAILTMHSELIPGWA